MATTAIWVVCMIRKGYPFSAIVLLRACGGRLRTSGTRCKTNNAEMSFNKEKATLFKLIIIHFKHFHYINY